MGSERFNSFGISELLELFSSFFAITNFSKIYSDYFVPVVLTITVVYFFWSFPLSTFFIKKENEEALPYLAHAKAHALAYAHANTVISTQPGYKKPDAHDTQSAETPKSRPESQGL